MRAFVLSMLLTACSLNVDYSGTHYQCNPDGSCPAGYECLAMVCVPTDPVPPACSSDLSSGGGHSCAVRSDGTVWCWGRNDFGQLGDGSATDSDIPVQVVGLEKVTKVGAGELYTCALDETLAVWCWGNNQFGQLGDGTNSDSRTAVKVRDLAGVMQLSVGHDHACALFGDGGMSCWGNNEEGAIGDGTTMARSVPTAVATAGPVRSISAGNDTSCAVLVDGTAQCWGENNEGELGVGDTMPHTRPTAVVGLTELDAPAAGDDFTCWLSGAGYVACAGLNTDGQLGTGTLVSSSLPVVVQLPVRARTLDAGNTHACVRDEVDSTWCWGNGANGRLLDDGFARRPLPVRGVVEDVEVVSAGAEHSCVLDRSGAIRCAGFNRRGQLGDGRTITAGTPIRVDGVTNAVAIVAGARHACAAQQDGQVLCWGENDNGEAGNGSYAGVQLVPHQVFGIASPKQMVAGAEHTCALFEDDSVFCWGANGGGRLGDGTMTSSSQPRGVFGIGGTPSRLSIGDSASFAVVGASVRAWGNGFGITPTTVASVMDISAGNQHVCTLQPDRTVVCYGENARGQLGDTTTMARVEPGVAAVGVANAIEVQARGDQSCALLMDGTIKCWGLNADGRLGVGNTQFQIATPTTVMGVSSVMKLAMGHDASCAIKTDGTLWCWGASYSGQVGDGSYQGRPTAVQILGVTGVKDVASGASHTCAINGNGEVMCWGLGASGQLGNGVREIIRPVGVRMTCP